MEKVVANRLQAHIKNKHLSNPLHSAYRKHHSTESALLKVHNDIIISMDQGEFTALTLLDLSATFDSIDHATLTNRLSDSYRISQIWFSSDLQNRHPMHYTTLHHAIISSFDINHHVYAGDTQIYMSLSVSNTKETLVNLQHCECPGRPG